MSAVPPFDSVVTEVDQLAELYRPPHPLVVAKKIDEIDDAARAMIAQSPFVLLSTSDAAGRCTVSPKGGTPGFVRVLDEHRLAIPDQAGNQLLDSLHNLLVNPHVGLLFLFPGHGEILRVSGQAWISTDPALLAGWSEAGRPPAAAVGVRVETVFVHCAASLRRARLWDPDSWAELDPPSTAEVADAHVTRTLSRAAEGATGGGNATG